MQRATFGNEDHYLHHSRVAIALLREEGGGEEKERNNDAESHFSIWVFGETEIQEPPKLHFRFSRISPEKKKKICRRSPFPICRKPNDECMYSHSRYLQLASPMKTVALLFLLSAASADSTLRGLPSSPSSSHGGRRRRLGSWGWCWSFWNCADSAGPKCAPTACANACPKGFTYKEDCGYWWWQSDRTWCEPDTVPGAAVEADADLEMRGWCSYSFTANGEGKFGAEPDKCPDGFVDGGVTEDTKNCCQPPLWARNNDPGKRALLIAPISCAPVRRGGKDVGRKPGGAARSSSHHATVEASWPDDLS